MGEIRRLIGRLLQNTMTGLLTEPSIRFVDYDRSVLDERDLGKRTLQGRNSGRPIIAFILKAFPQNMKVHGMSYATPILSLARHERLQTIIRNGNLRSL